MSGRKRVIISSAKDPSKCLHLYSGFTHNGTAVHLWTQLPNNHPEHLNQEWIVDFDKIEILSAKDPSKGLHLEGPTHNGAKVHLWEQSVGNENQKWSMKCLRTNTYSIGAAKAECKFLTLEGPTHDGAKVHLWGMSVPDELDRLWIFTEV